jgi:hypothetical protein
MMKYVQANMKPWTHFEHIWKYNFSRAFQPYGESGSYVFTLTHAYTRNVIICAHRFVFIVMAILGLDVCCKLVLNHKLKFLIYNEATRLDANCIPVLVLVSTNTNTPRYSVTAYMYCIPVLVLVSTNTNAPLHNVTASMKERGTKIKRRIL